MKKKLGLWLLVLACSPLPPASSECSVSARPVVFGTYDVLSESPLDAEGEIIVTCVEETGSTRVDIAISPSSATAAMNPRQMRSATGEVMDYNLYTDAGHRNIWGNGEQGSSAQMGKIKHKDDTLSLPIYGLIQPGQDIAAGSYEDTLTVTITW